MKELAIIIPAYKPNYLDKMLLSIVHQTNVNFTVYIGDDNSPHDLFKIVNKYKNEIDIKYHKFPNNLGGVSLVQHWQRCIELSHENWIWLFSDDDIMSYDCVEKFYIHKESIKSEFYKFKIAVIDGNDNLVPFKNKRINEIGAQINVNEFLNLRLCCNGYKSFAVEYIFSRAMFDKFKFIEFPLAWGSDDATWAVYMEANQGCTIIDSLVFWRNSGINISTSVMNKDVSKSKLDASFTFVRWLKNFACEHSIDLRGDLLFHWYCIQAASINVDIKFNGLQETKRQLSLNVSWFYTIKQFIIIRYYQSKNKFIFLIRKYF